MRIDYKAIAERQKEMITNMVERGVPPALASETVTHVASLLATRNALTTELNTLQAERKAAAGAAKKSKGRPSPESIAAARALKERASALREEERALGDALEAAGKSLPNWSMEGTPVGGDEACQVVRTRGELPEPAGWRDHVSIGTARGWWDFEAGGKVAGPAFYYARGAAVRLERAISSYALDMAEQAGFGLTSVPEIVHAHVLERCGFQPRGEAAQVFHVSSDAVFDEDEANEKVLIGTAEIPLAGRYLDSLLSAEDVVEGGKSAALSQCYRAEAGASGKATRGLYRVHQFGKVELFALSPPETSPSTHQDLLELSESIVAGLDLPYRVLRMATGELGAPAAAKYDIEAWMPSRNGYGEVASISNCTDYQSRRLNLRFRPSPSSRPIFPHTLNGTAAALPRLLLALIENHTHQATDGSDNYLLSIPPALSPYLNNATTL